MGGGYWTVGSYNASTARKIASGSTFSYDRSAKSSNIYKAHKDLDPTQKNVEGLNLRESRDNKEHPNSIPIILGFDETGSMGSIPRKLQQSLKRVFSTILDKGYITDPQIAITAYGDAYYDRVPL